LIVEVEEVGRVIYSVHGLPFTNHQSPITNHQSPITNHQSPITNHQSPIINYQLSIINYQLSIINYASPRVFSTPSNRVSTERVLKHSYSIAWLSLFHRPFYQRLHSHQLVSENLSCLALQERDDIDRFDKLFVFEFFFLRDLASVCFCPKVFDPSKQLRTRSQIEQFAGKIRRHLIGCRL